MPNVFMMSLGCAKNTVDAEMALAALLGEGFDLVLDAATADLAIVNTCGFIEPAREEAYSAIAECLDAKRRRGGRRRRGRGSGNGCFRGKGGFRPAKERGLG